MTAPSRSRAWTIVGAASLVLVTALAAGFAIGTGAAERPGGGEALAFAATVCLAGGLAGWLLARWPVTLPARRVSQALAGVAVRLFTPLFALGWVQTSAPGLRAGGGREWLLVFYLLLLATDIFLHIMGARNGAKTRRNSSAN